MWRALALVSCAMFLSWVAGFYHPGLGFSAFLMLPGGDEEYQLPVLRTIPHYQYPPRHGYDGAMYVQLAMVPLLRDPAIDRTLDAPAYRARRILFCWTAYALGLGRPAWIMQAYALQNVLGWLLLAWLITRWFPLDTPRAFALWAASMFSHGLVTSVRLAVLDGPSLLLLACAAAAAERGRTWLTAAILGIAGLGRETNLLGAVALPWPSGWRGWARAGVAVVVIVLPLLVWQDYIWSIYRGTSVTEGAGQITVPFSAYLMKWRETLRNQAGIDRLTIVRQMLVIVALSVQAVYIVWTRRWTAPWWRLAAVFAVLLMTVHWSVWEGYPGAVTRVVLPLKLGFNVLLARDQPRGFWAWLVLGNLDLSVSAGVLPFI
jgi:hypothetical protein